MKKALLTSTCKLDIEDTSKLFVEKLDRHLRLVLHLLVRSDEHDGSVRVEPFEEIVIEVKRLHLLENPESRVTGPGVAKHIGEVDSKGRKDDRGESR